MEYALTERERNIIELRYGLGRGAEVDEPFTLEKIGEHIGLTRERVRQIENQALRKLQIFLAPKGRTRRTRTERAPQPAGAEIARAAGVPQAPCDHGDPARPGQERYAQGGAGIVRARLWRPRRQTSGGDEHYAAFAGQE